MSSLQEEVQSYKAQLEAAASKEHGARESELSYRKQLEELKTRLAEAERDLMESSSETISHETQHRSEVSNEIYNNGIYCYFTGLQEKKKKSLILGNVFTQRD